ncbi:NACHT domain-containing protein [Amycolatopsis sp. NPDC024027]|uniref:NACHT domain-containing protein n=1 Tax=Amycolatopsis sp. NPDC024027 TaxID=3154327 RepID=UPI0033D32D36
MTSGFEASAARALSQVSWKLFGAAEKRMAKKRVRRDARTLVSTRVAESFLTELKEDETRKLSDYLGSPDFEEIALQFVLGRSLGDIFWESATADIREQLRHGLRASAGLRKELLVTATDVVFDSLATAFDESVDINVSAKPDSSFIAVATRLTTAAVANSQLLRGLENLTEFHDFASALRVQVASQHEHMRPPHLGLSKSVPYDQLYIEPSVLPIPDHPSETPHPARLALSGHRSVILGDPGAGKSTLAAKLAHDVASDLVPGAEGRVPLLLVLRNHAGSFRDGGKSLVHYLERTCADPYNLEPPDKAIEYLLRNGRAVVMLDGLDELVEPDLRRKVVDLVHGFVNLYPLVPVLATARRIGYSDAPLTSPLFSHGAIAELDNDQVRYYAEHWFALDERIPKLERPQICNSFMAESEGISELRSNPLLLALLCALYASERYIPSNLAQVYERCATMLFDRWDSMRGIAKPFQFVGRLRAAVQYLAWQLFTARESGKAQPRHAIVRTLTDHLTAKKFDEDEASATAEQFVDFCTGRAWILTDVGATEQEPRFGFTHRTFMEYFAAEHLVRTHSTAERLWNQLDTHILDSEWEMVAQISLQLLDRNIDGAVDDFLSLVLEFSSSDHKAGSTLYPFAARTLRYVHPRPDTIADVVSAALECSLDLDIGTRGHYGFARGVMTLDADEALRDLVGECSPANLPTVQRKVVTHLEGQIYSGNETAMLLVLRLAGASFLGRMGHVWDSFVGELRDRHESRLRTWGSQAPWASIAAGEDPGLILTRFGLEPLYKSVMYPTAYHPSVIEQILSADEPFNRFDFFRQLQNLPHPWISDDHWWRDFQALSSDDSPLGQQEVITPGVLLLLPCLEMYEHGHQPFRMSKVDQVMAELIEARAKRGNRSIISKLDLHPSFTNEMMDFLMAWTNGEFDLVVPPPPPE